VPLIARRRAGNSPMAVALVSALLMPSSAALSGGVTSSTDLHQFVVEGTTAVELVRHLNRNAFEGDSGRAYANMHPDYQLSLTTKQSGGICRPASVGMHVALRLTLPVADTSVMSGRTRALWNNFMAFARAHENHHKVTYLDCARRYIQQAQRQSAASCAGLQWTLQQELADMQRACEASEQPFERSQARLLPNLPLFRAAQTGH
jgi:predicted secreted Zn-dependent protease